MADKVIIEAEVKSNVGEVTKDVNKLDKATGKAKGGFKGMGLAIKGMGTALKAAGIGIVVALMAKLMQVFASNQKVVDTFNTTMTGLSIAFNDLFRYLDDNYTTIKGYLKGLFTDPLGELAKLGEGIQQFFINKMSGAVTVLKGAWTIMSNLTNPKKMAEGLALIAVGTLQAGKDIADIYADIESSVSNYIGTVTDQAKGLTALEKAARAAGTEYNLLNAEFLKEAELQRQIRDDVSKTFAVRIEANEELGRILEKQEELQRAAIQKQVDSALALHNIDKTNLDNKIAYQETLVAQAQLEEAIGGQRSEQLTNQVGLEEELRDAQAQTLAEGMSGMERELQELKTAYDAKIRLAEKAGMKTLAITKQYEKQKTAVVQANMNAQLEAFSGLAGALSALAGDNKALAVASAVIDTYVGANKAFAQGGTLGFVTGAAVIAAGLNNVKTILATDVPSSGGGGGGSVGATPQTPAPEMLSGAFTLSGGVKPEPMQAYVVSDDITNNQNKLAIIRRRATI
tara:strand:+ start:1485 stop:3026 length:1542 start_codon:yes stop_codon:yes gene_type:complete